MYQILSAYQRDCAGDGEDMLTDKLECLALTQVQDKLALTDIVGLYRGVVFDDWGIKKC